MRQAYKVRIMVRQEEPKGMTRPGFDFTTITNAATLLQALENVIPKARKTCGVFPPEESDSDA